MKCSACTRILLLAAFSYAADKREFITDCLIYFGPASANIPDDIVTFVCTSQYKAANYFDKGAHKCSNNTNKIGDSSVEVIHFRHCQMSQIPHNVNIFKTYKSVYELNISSMELEELNAATFSGAWNLTKINASYNRLQEIRDGQFAFAGSLTTADLSFNNISKIGMRAFDERSIRLQSMDLSHNAIQYIRSGTFDKLENLAYLSLAFNRLEMIEAGMFLRQPMLTVLNASYNNIKTVQLMKTFSSSRRIEFFNVTGNENIKVIGYDVYAFPHLSVCPNTSLSTSVDLSETNNSHCMHGSLIPVLCVLCVFFAVTLIIGFLYVRTLWNRFGTETMSHNLKKGFDSSNLMTNEYSA